MPNPKDVLDKHVHVPETNPAAGNEWCTNLKEVDTDSYLVLASNMCEYSHFR